MMSISYHRKFIKEFNSLEKHLQLKLATLEQIFIQNAFHPQLHTKRLKGKLQNLFSFRITREYRVVFEFVADAEVRFLAVKHRRDIYKDC